MFGIVLSTLLKFLVVHSGIYYADVKCVDLMLSIFCLQIKANIAMVGALDGLSSLEQEYSNDPVYSSKVCIKYIWYYILFNFLSLVLECFYHVTAVVTVDRI